MRSLSTSPATRTSTTRASPSGTSRTATASRCSARGGDDPPFEDAPVAGFLVDDVAAARAELEQLEGVEFIGPIHDDGGFGNQWSHFRAPDGQVYEVTNRPDHPLTRARHS